MGENVEVIIDTGEQNGAVVESVVEEPELSEAEKVQKAKLEERERLMASLRGEIYQKADDQKEEKRKKREADALLDAEARKIKETTPVVKEKDRSVEEFDADLRPSGFGMNPENIVIGKREDYDPQKDSD